MTTNEKKTKRKFESKYFDYQKDYRDLNIRDNPYLYQVGKGEQGVLMVQPYKSEILPYWRFKTPEIARESSNKIYELFLDYKKKNDFIGMDMARKFLQMGYTRSRRYANHKSGKKYTQNPQYEKTIDDEKAARAKFILPQEEDCLTNDKAKSARIFYEKYLLSKEDKEYQEMKKEHIQKQKEFQSKLDNSVEDVSSNSNNKKQKMKEEEAQNPIKEEKESINSNSSNKKEEVVEEKENINRGKVKKNQKRCDNNTN